MLGVRQLLGFVLPRLQLRLIAAWLQHSMHGPKKKQKKNPEILEKVIQQMFEVMQMVAEFSCNYIKGRSQACSGFGKY